ncbi:hypothetical protein WICMUC_002813 [Wickerhamomyces mucosus]|uniref:Ornithine decarboxylase n=1 Tax=Wickerhamomyces mucosus TaxID=1378264 RepID=A0A9P8PNH4_9ASCO|nr:hypothetical protein WICMUC_002813 [Wickerhamomyces mucosus]
MVNDIPQMSMSTSVQSSSSPMLETERVLLANINKSESSRPDLKMESLKLSTVPPKDTAIETENSKQLISKALFDQVTSINHDTCEPGDEDPFFVCDLGKVERLYYTWIKSLPRVHPYYAVKCNPNEQVLKLLASLGVNFDCASKGEIETVLSLGIDPSRIIYAHPCKVGSFLRFSKTVDVNLTTFDNSDELYKVKKHHPTTRLLLRIITDDESAQCRLSTKYGAPLANVSNLLKLAKQLELNIAGVSFHVGSGANDFGSLVKAVKDARDVFDLGRALGFSMDILDVGGGFSYESFNESSKALNFALNEYFPLNENVSIIAEPGRYFVANAFTLAVNVIAKRGGVLESSTSSDNSSPAMVYVNDGVYGNMNCILFDHQTPKAKVLTHRGEFLYDDLNAASENRFNVSIWGPTCDGLDCISDNALLSHNVSVGDWLYFPDLGAYTSAAASPFNGFKANAHTIYVNSESC